MNDSDRAPFSLRVKATPNTLRALGAVVAAGGTGGGIAVAVKADLIDLPAVVSIPVFWTGLAILSLIAVLAIVLLEARRSHASAHDECRREIAEVREECRRDREAILGELRAALADGTAVREQRIDDIRPLLQEAHEAGTAMAAAVNGFRDEVRALRGTIGEILREVRRT